MRTRGHLPQLAQFLDFDRAEIPRACEQPMAAT
jgi:hypothetical protein